MIEGKRVLITGGTGSFGQKFAEIALTMNPKAIRIFSRRETPQADMERRFNDRRLGFYVGDIRDFDRVSEAMEGVDIVVHAAAMKRVEKCELDPEEAIKTNVDGAVNIRRAAKQQGVSKVIALSTDKAVEAHNVYGHSKAQMEDVFVRGAVYTQHTKYACTRYGNVLGSNGSVLHLFKEQAKTGVVTITHPDMTRFWITLEQGVRFVLSCIDRMEGGEILVPKLPSAKVVDLARLVAPNAEQKVIGLRPGEKIHEVLVTEYEHVIDHGDRYTILQDATGSGFRYSSDNNRMLTTAELEAMLYAPVG